MSTEMTAVVLALVGVAAVVLVAWAFYLVGRAEDRDREAARKQQQEPPPPSPRHEEPPHSAQQPGRARERRRPLPPRRPG
jgi:hypothetical protein